MKKINFGAVLFVVIMVVAVICLSVDVSKYTKAKKAADKVIMEWIDIASGYINIPDNVIDGDEEDMEVYLKGFAESIEKFYCSTPNVTSDDVVQAEVSILRSFIERLKSNENSSKPLSKCSVKFNYIDESEIKSGYYKVKSCYVSINLDGVETSGAGSSKWITVFDFILKEVDGEWKMSDSFFGKFGGVMNRISEGTMYVVY